jgi:alanine racemase
MPRPLVATIRLAALRHNFEIARRQTPLAKIWAVVKANGYGHGLERVMRGFDSADGLALIEPEGALYLRELGWGKPILLLEGCFDAADMALAARHQFDLTIHCVDQLDLFEQTPISAPLHIHLKMNSGMNRLGFTPADFVLAYQRLRNHPAVASLTLMTHFANADVEDSTAVSVSDQMQVFSAVCSTLDGIWSVSNSAAGLRHPDLRSDWVRPGIMLYGASPGTFAASDVALQPAMTLRSKLIGIQQLAIGDAVGYGSRFVAAAPMKIGVVACGYADGYPRHAPSGTPILVDGIMTRVVGNISMDMLMVDLSPIPDARIGSNVILWGDGLPIDQVARAAGTIGYELMCAIAARVRVVELA